VLAEDRHYVRAVFVPDDTGLVVDLVEPAAFLGRLDIFREAVFQRRLQLVLVNDLDHLLGAVGAQDFARVNLIEDVRHVAGRGPVVEGRDDGSLAGHLLVEERVGSI
jgi:hypothetical protein